MTETEKPGANKRFHPRYTLKLPAMLRGAGDKPYGVEVYDFCVGGMYLILNSDVLLRMPVAVGQTVQITLPLPESHHQPFQFPAKVVRSDLHHLGVSFIAPDIESIKSVLRFAAERQAKNLSSRPTSGKKRDHKQSLTAMLSIAERELRGLLEGYLETLQQRFIDKANNASNLSLQNDYFHALEAFGPGGSHFKKLLYSSLSEMLKRKPSPAFSKVQLNGEPDSLNALSLVENDDLDFWIARSDIANKSESHYHDELLAIEQCLTEIYGTPITEGNNPLGPEMISNAFQGALQKLRLSKQGYLVCCKVFRDALFEGADALYSAVITQLKKEGYSLEINYQIKKSTGGSHHKEMFSEQEVKESKALYDLISNLYSLQQKSQGEDPEKANLPEYSPQELLKKLTALIQHDVERIKSSQAAGKEAPDSLSLRLLHQLQGEKADKKLSQHETSVMATTGGLYDEIFHDRLITAGVKAWLGEMELPLLNEALQDDTVLYDPNHIGRQFINKIAQLEHYNDNRRGAIKGSVRDTIDKLLDELSEKQSLQPEVVNALLTKVDSLLSVQDKAYQDNISDVLVECRNGACLAPLQLETPINQLTGLDDAELREARKQIRRMKIGDWILFDADSSNAKRLRLVWVSNDFNNYVFVNIKGQLQGGINVDMLAAHLCSGVAIVLDNADEPALDRAQYGMLQKLHKQLIYESTHDPLTGLMNRREFERELQKLKEPKIGEHHLICYYDLDYFDVINNSYGFEVGDQLLVEVANLFTEVIGGQGVLARVGGNEFALLLEESHIDNAQLVTEQLRAAVKDHPFVLQDNSSSISFCSGIVPVDMQHQEVPRLLQTAEAACRLAKGKGVNQLHIIQMDDRELKKSKQVIYWASRIDESLNNDTLMLRYQPIVPISNHKLQPHAEILLGVSDQFGKLISPEHFILAAERYRRMPEIDRWVLVNVLGFFKQQPELLEQLGGIAINLSGLSINDESTIPFILEQLELSQLPPSRICFEVTETAGIESLSNAAAFITEIKQSGVSFSLDDFGTGMSSYAYLKSLPVDFIKIDGSFVRDIANNQGDRAVVKSVTEIGHFMGKKIIAECVEDQQCLDILKEIGVDYGQGYAIHRPQLLSGIRPVEKS